ncbi:MAG: sugar transporter permease [Paenibacillus sp.]|jgi:putative aldouronate transport system permease protein|nr:sugar transporter permease [Paenibacillus sp.]
MYQNQLHKKRVLKQNIPLFVMFLPVIAFFLIVKYAPMLGLVMAFKDYTFYEGIWNSQWVGLDNFELLFSNPQSINIIRNTLVLSVLNIVLGFPMPILIAVLLNEVRTKWFQKSVQTLIYLPHFFSWVIVGGFVVTIFSMESGIVNKITMSLFGFTKPFLYEAPSWITIFLGSGIWKEAGFGAIIYLAAMTTIDPSLYEAASMDGASRLRQIWHVTLPGIRTTVVLLLILSMGRVMEVGFDQVLMLQNNVVSNVSEVISTYIYKVGLRQGQFSLTAAMGMFESTVGFILVFTANRIARKFNQGLW